MRNSHPKPSTREAIAASIVETRRALDRLTPEQFERLSALVAQRTAEAIDIALAIHRPARPRS